MRATWPRVSVRQTTKPPSHNGERYRAISILPLLSSSTSTSPSLLPLRLSARFRSNRPPPPRFSRRRCQPCLASGPDFSPFLSVENRHRPWARRGRGVEGRGGVEEDRSLLSRDFVSIAEEIFERESSEGRGRGRRRREDKSEGVLFEREKWSVILEIE